MAPGAMVVVLIALLGGCGAGDDRANGELTVHVSLPLRGESGEDGRDAMRGARLALADAGGRAGDLRVGAKYHDDTSGPASSARWDPVQVAENARTAIRDSTAIAYIGDFESGATRMSLPITNSARLLQVSPASSAFDLVSPFPGSNDVPEGIQTSGERTFGRVISDDEAVGKARRGWGGGRARSTIGVLHPGANHRALRRQGFARAVSAAQDPSQLPPAGRKFVDDFERRYGEPPDRYAAYGYEAMAVVLDSIERASDGADREAVIDAFFETHDRDSILGTYTIDELGNTTLDRLAGYRIEGRRPVFERPLRVP